MIKPIGSSSPYSCRSATHSEIVDGGVARLDYRHVKARQIQGELGDGSDPRQAIGLTPQGVTVVNQLIEIRRINVGMGILQLGIRWWGMF
jgi:hypothetical protein